ncbi:MAG: DoxX family protein [Acidimicrobiaceae bacterium]|nr:DoxX family protein [Acidimicrobiaceae bacterium]
MSGSHFDLALFVLRVAFGASIAYHGYNKVSRGLKGTASWFANIGMRQPKLQARFAASTEMIVGVLLCLGLFTELASAGLIALMIVAITVAHRKNGYFIFKPGQGWEYCAAIAVVGFVLGLTGPGNWSLDDTFGRTAIGSTSGLTNGSTSGLMTGAFVLGLGLISSALQLAVFWRPNSSKKKSSKASS